MSVSVFRRRTSTCTTGDGDLWIGDQAGATFFRKATPEELERWQREWVLTQVGLEAYGEPLARRSWRQRLRDWLRRVLWRERLSA